MMIEVVGVNFKPHGQVYYFDPGSLKLKDNIISQLISRRFLG